MVMQLHSCWPLKAEGKFCSYLKQQQGEVKLKIELMF